MRFTGKQLTAMMKVAFVIAKSDDDFAEKEMDIIIREMATFGLSQQEARALVDLTEEMDASELFSILTTMTKEQQKYVCAFMAVVMIADGEIKNSEIDVWQKICTLCSFPSMSMKEALEFWKNN